MKRWVIKEDQNIADVLVIVYGKDEKDLLNNIIQAFASIITDLDELEVQEEFTFEIANIDFSLTVFNLIEKLVYLKDVRSLLFKRGVFEIIRGDKLILRGRLYGAKITVKLPIKVDIKALTHHKFNVSKNGYYKAVLVFDI